MIYTAGVALSAVAVAVCQHPALSATCEAKFAEANRAAAAYEPWQVRPAGRGGGRKGRGGAKERSNRRLKSGRERRWVLSNRVCGTC